MASPPAKKKPPTTISDLDQDTLREILFRLPSLPSLVRAALSCRTFLDAVRSSSAFSRRFRALHPPPVLGLFLSIEDAVSPAFVPLRRRPDPDLAAAVRGADFFLTRLPVPEDDKEDAVSVPVPVPVPEDDGVAVSVRVREDDDEDAVSVGKDGDEDAVSVPEGDDEDAVSIPEGDDDDDAVFQCSICDCRGGFVLLGNWSTEQMAAYNPLTRTLDIFPLPPRQSPEDLYVEFHILASEQDYRLFRVVCVRHCEFGACAVVFSSDTRKWQIFQWTEMNGLWPQQGTVVNGCIFWTIGAPADARVLNTATMQFFRMDMPPRRRVNETLTAGETKDGRLCVVFAPNVALRPESALVIWIW